MQQKPSLEHIDPNVFSSIFIKQHDFNHPNTFLSWHFHPELELVYIKNVSGKRHIGSHLSYFDTNQLLLVGSNLPHQGFANNMPVNGKETIVQFKPNFLGDAFFNLPETFEINNLLERSKQGLLFTGEEKDKIGLKVEALMETSGFNRTLLFLEILNDLAQQNDYKVLNGNGYAFESDLKGSHKVDTIFSYITAHFKDDITLEAIADKTGMTVPSFCRFFKKATGKTFTKVLNEYRIVHATKLITETDHTITDICYECGFNSFSYFNTQFNLITGKSASKYRKDKRAFLESH